MLDYRKVLDIIDHAVDPAVALEAFVAQECETAAYEAQSRVLRVLDDISDRMPVWGPNDSGEMMLDISKSDFDAIVREIRDAALGIEHQTPTRRRNS